MVCGIITGASFMFVLLSVFEIFGLMKPTLRGGLETLTSHEVDHLRRDERLPPGT